MVSFPGQGTGLGCGFGAQLGHMKEATNQCFSLTSIFLSLSFSLPSPLYRINKNFFLKKQTKFYSISLCPRVLSLTTCPADFRLASPHISRSLEIAVCLLLFSFLWRTLTDTSGIYRKAINKMEPLHSPQTHLLNTLSPLSFYSLVSNTLMHYS